MYSKDHLFNGTNSSNSSNNSFNNRSSVRDSDAWSAYGVVATPANRPSPPPCVKGGVLVFFPSYSVMDSSISHWKQIGIYDKLKNIVGSVISESRAAIGNSTNSNGSSGSSSGSSSSNGHSSTSFMTTKARVITAVDDTQDQEFSSVVNEFNQSIDRYGGCVLMAVCRGKGR